MTDLDGVAAIVTGGASGIGRATALMMRDRGARAASLDLARPEQPDAGVEDIECDITDAELVSRAVTEAAQRLGGVDVLVNNAGVGAQGTIESTDGWDRVWNVNVLGAVLVTRAALPWLRGSARACVVNIGSIAGWTGLPRRAAYSASKGAVHALTLAMAADHLQEGIRVNAVAPGTVDTPWVRRLLDAADHPMAERAALERRQPTGRLVSAPEVAHAVCYLASPLSGSTTGAILGVDGGSHSLLLPPGGPHG